jgi:Siphovirus Gp157
MTTYTEYQLNQAIFALQSAQNRLANEESDISEDELDFLRSETDVKSLLERAIRATIHAESMEEAAAKRIKEIQVRKERYKRRAEALRGAVFTAMDALDEQRVEIPDALVTRGKGTTSYIVMKALFLKSIKRLP